MNLYMDYITFKGIREGLIKENIYKFATTVFLKWTLLLCLNLVEIN